MFQKIFTNAKRFYIMNREVTISTNWKPLQKFENQKLMKNLLIVFKMYEFDYIEVYYEEGYDINK